MPTVNIHAKPEHLKQSRQHFQRLVAGGDPEHDPEEIKRELRALLAGRGDGIDLDTPTHWAVEGVSQPAAFFSGLPLLLTPDDILYFEGTSIATEISAFYGGQRARNPVAVVRDCVFPVPEIYHVTFSQEVLGQLQAWATSRPTEELFDHIKAYRRESLLFTFHDAFAGCLRISEHLPETSVLEFCRRLGVMARREPTKRRDPEQLRRMLWMMENSDQVRFAWEPWWKRLWRRWTQR